MILYLFIIFAAYLVGSLASAIIVCRALGLPDPRSGGSGNPGATNVLRLGGRGAAALTLAGDVAKGVLPVILARAAGAPEWVVAAAAVAAFLGHLYPIFFGFRGGKGVATALGAVAGLSWPTFFATGLIWLVTAGVWRYSSLASLLSTSLTPVFAWFLTGSIEMVVASAVIAAFIVWRHRGNIERLLAGTESRLGKKSAPATGGPEDPAGQ